MDGTNKRLKTARIAANFTSARAAALRHGWTPSTYASHENGQTPVPRKAADSYAKAFKVSAAWLLTGEGAGPSAERAAPKSSALTNVTKATRSGETLAPNARMGAPVGDFGRVPIRGQSMGGKDGSLIFSTSDNMGDIIAPPVLFNVPDAYAVYVVGDSMLERFRDGEVVFVHPHQRVVKGMDCVIQIEAGDGHQRQGWVKRFVSFDDKTLKVLQLHPKKILTFPRKKVVSVHKIVMSGPV